MGKKLSVTNPFSSSLQQGIWLKAELGKFTQAPDSSSMPQEEVWVPVMNSTSAIWPPQKWVWM